MIYTTATVSDATVTEGDGTTLQFVVTLSEAVSRDVVIAYETVDGTAIAGEDYVAQSGTLTIAAGQTTGVISITVLDDSDAELDETLQLQLAGIKNVILDNDTATGTILTDETPIAPVVDSLTVGSAPAGQVIVINSDSIDVTLAAHDDDNTIVGWMISESSTTPAVDSADWIPVTAIGSLIVSSTYTFSTGDGLKTLYAWVIDEGGVISATAIGSNRVSVDTTVSVITVDRLATQEVSPEITGTYGADENVESIMVTINNETHAATLDGSGNWSVAAGTFTSLSVGQTYNVVAVATDSIGNTGTDSTTNELTIDQTAPEVLSITLIDSEGNVDDDLLTNDQDAVIQLIFSEAVYGDNDDITVTDPDGNQIEVVSVDGWGTATLTVTVATMVTDGTYDVALDTTNTITDRAGNVLTDTSSTFSFAVDSSAPTVVINTTVTQSGSPEISGTIDELVDSLALKIDGQVYSIVNFTYDASTGTYNWVLSAGQISPSLDPGTYDIMASTVDTAGNIVINTVSSGISIDYDNPTLVSVEMVGQSSSLISDATPQFKLTFSEAVTGGVADIFLVMSNGVTIVPDSIEWGSSVVTVTFSTAISSGDYTLQISSTHSIEDAIGNALEVSDYELMEFTVDATVPTVTVYTQRTTSSSPKIKGYVSDEDATVYVTVLNKTFKASMNGHVWTVDLSDEGVSLYPGRYDISVEAVDDAGNVGQDTTTGELSIFLLSGTFDDYPLDEDWVVVDQATNSASHWVVDSYGQLLQVNEVGDASTDDAGLSDPGTMVIYNQGDDFSDYSVFISMATNDQGSLGVVFRYVDDNNYYRFSWATDGTMELVKCEDGVFTLLASEQKTLTLGESYTIEISAIGSQLTINQVSNETSTFESNIRRTELLTASDDTFLSGSFGFYSYRNNRTYFGDLIVESQEGVDLDPVIDEVVLDSNNPISELLISDEVVAWTSISDLDTVQMSVVAHDPNTDDTLYYLWTIESGDDLGSGTILNAHSANATFVPNDILEDEYVAIRVFVSDEYIADDTDTSELVSAVILIKVVDGEVITLLEEDFSESTFDWRGVNQGTQGGDGTWTIKDGSLVQTTNAYNRDDIYSIDKRGTFAVYATGFWWDNYEVSVDVTTTDNDGNGVMFRVQDENNYYRFSWSSEQGYAQLVKCVDGEFQLLAEVDMSYQPGETYRITISVDDEDQIIVSIDGWELMTYEDDDDPITSGTIAMYTYGCKDTSFSNIVVTNLNDVNPAPIINSVTASATNITDLETTTLTVDATDVGAEDNDALTYVWTCSIGSGQILNAFSSTAIFQPTNVSESEEVIITVTVSDGENTVSKEITINVIDSADILLQDDFSDGTLDVNWNNPTGKGSWTVQNGQLVQSSNVGTIGDSGLAQLGTYLQYDTGNDVWENYDVYLNLMSQDNDYIGIMFRVVDENNYYRMTWNATTGLTIVKCLDGEFTALYSDSDLTYTEGETYAVKISVVDNYIQLWIDDEYITGLYDLTDAISSGTIALYSNINEGSYFDDIVVIQQD